MSGDDSMRQSGERVMRLRFDRIDLSRLCYQPAALVAVHC